MERDGQLLFNRRGGYCLMSRLDLLKGRVIGHPDGFGFVVLEQGGDDVFLGPREMQRVFHGDRVVITISGMDRRGRPEGKIIEVLERALTKVVGRFFSEGGAAFVIPENKRLNQDIVIPSDLQMGAREGQIVSVEILEYPSKRRHALGKVIEILGDHMAPGMEIDIAIRNYDLPEEWPLQVNDEIAELQPEVTEESKQGREDIRQLPLVTIDGEDSRDFDDAVYVERLEQGWKLIVAIADVSSYVSPGSALDAEARLRGNSVYFPERVIPMLPELLSNGLCSINPDVDRLCLCCELRFDEHGDVHQYHFFEGVMRSHARLTYTKVADMLLEGDKELRRQYEHVLTPLEAAYDLYRVMRKHRERRGAMDFDTQETQIIFNEARKIERIKPRERNAAHMLIEEFMVAANVAAAKFLLKNEQPGLYRVHETPSLEKLTGLREFLAELGLDLKGGEDPKPMDFKSLLDTVDGRPDEHLIETVVLRTMKQAVYSPDNLGHFGLAFDAYTHFTSPIRRYPDLIVHRAIRHILAKQGQSVSSGEYPYDEGRLLELGEHCSMTERRADEATRDATEWLKCEYMMDKVGDSFDGVVTAVTSFGLFVELKDIFVEGLVHVTSLKNDYYHFDPTKHRLVGERNRTAYRLADEVRITVTRVDLDERKIDFTLEGVENEPREKKKRKKKKR
jgi:ribonuclease R